MTEPINDERGPFRAELWVRGALLACLAGLGLSLVVSPGALAAPADLDPTFSGDGKVVTDLSGGSDSVRGIAIQPDGRIVVAGTSDASTDAADLALARYSPDGSLDTTFSGDGLVTTDLGGEDTGFAIAVQPDGRIVVSGSTFLGGSVLARYLPDGSLDPTFSGDGKVIGPMSAGYGVALQPDGKIVQVGEEGSSDGADWALARFDPDGSLDSSFSDDGIQTTQMGFRDTAFDVAIAAEGRIVVSGYSQWSAGSYFLVARYGADGQHDPGFPAYDQIQSPPFGGDGVANGLALQPDGKAVASGFAFFTTQPARDFALARYNTNGSLDPGFAGDGTQVTETGHEMQSYDVAVAPDGRIVVAGFQRVFDEDANFAIARYEPAGAPDPAFSGDGLQITDFSNSSDGAEAVAIQADGKIVAAGASGGQFALVRYHGEAAPDASVPDTRIVSGPDYAAAINDPTPSFGFASDDPDASYECRRDSRTWEACSGPGARDTFPEMANGIHWLEVRARNPLGNVDPSPASRWFVIDTHAPQTTIRHPISKTRDRTPTFLFYVEEPNATSACRVDRASYRPCDAEFTAKRLARGRHTFQVVSVDRAGNIGPTAAARFTVTRRR